RVGRPKIVVPIARLGDATAGVTAEGGLAVSVRRPLAGGMLQAGVELRRDEPARWGIQWEIRFCRRGSMRIAFCGPRGTGQTTLAEYLVKHHGLDRQSVG